MFILEWSFNQTNRGIETRRRLSPRRRRLCFNQTNRGIETYREAFCVLRIVQF